MEKAYGRVNREALWQVLRMYDVGRKLLSGIENMYVNSLACVRVKWVESECFSIDGGVRYRCIMSPGLLNIYIYEYSDEGGENRWGESVDCLASCIQMTWFCVASRRNT